MKEAPIVQGYQCAHCRNSLTTTEGNSSVISLRMTEVVHSLCTLIFSWRSSSKSSSSLLLGGEGGIAEVVLGEGGRRPRRAPPQTGSVSGRCPGGVGAGCDGKRPGGSAPGAPPLPPQVPGHLHVGDLAPTVPPQAPEGGSL